MTAASCSCFDDTGSVRFQSLFHCCRFLMSSRTFFVTLLSEGGAVLVDLVVPSLVCICLTIAHSLQRGDAAAIYVWDLWQWP